MTILRRSGLSVLPSFLAGYCQTIISISPIPSNASMPLIILNCFLGRLQHRSFLRALCLWASENVHLWVGHLSSEFLWFRKSLDDVMIYLDGF